jgi:cellulose synthase/poly-beta-1,6-N-acetylglucosamine synthase-like glycosyltransferase
MQATEWGFWSCAAAVAYTYAGYPVLLGALAAVKKKRPATGDVPTSVSVVIAARNEQKTIGRRTREFLRMLATAGLDGELIIVSDGSTDATVSEVRAAQREVAGPVACHVIELTDSGGKAAALTRACEIASREIIVFADARQTWAPDALTLMLQGFADPTVGAVSGDLVLESSPGVMAGVSAYWRYEKWLRRSEGAVHSMVGATGAISAVRRNLFRAIPQGTLLDDVYWPLRVAMQGFRVVQVKGAVAYDRLPEKARDEFRRKVRTLAGNFQLAMRLPSALVPFLNPIWLQYVSHKLMRLLVPWMMLAMLLISAILPGTLYRALLIAQLVGLVIGLTGLLPMAVSRTRLVSAAASFLVLNAAAWMAFWVWITGKSTRSWTRVAYTGPRVAVETAERRP